MAQLPNSQKIVDISDLQAIVHRLREDNRTVVQCNGVFDLVHVGHIRHLEAARARGDVLVVTVTADEAVRRGPGRPAFPLPLRLETLAALECIDYVAANPWPTAEASIRFLEPSVYARGPDYRQERGMSRNEDDEEAAIAAVGGRFVVTEDISFTAASLVNPHLALPSEETQTYLAAVAKRYTPDRIEAWLEEARRLRVLVVGEAIIDEYRYVETIGKSSKEPLLATRFVAEDVFAGGIIAVANNVANFADRVDVLTCFGTEGDREEFLRRSLNPAVTVHSVRWTGAPNIVKRRYLENYTLAKLFEVYDIASGELPEAPRDEFRRIIDARLDSYDLVIAVDFGHGLIGPKARQVLAQQSPFLALNVQINAGNHPFHILGKYDHADFITGTEAEVRLDARDPRGDLRMLIAGLSAKLNAAQVVVTRGKYGCLTFGRDDGYFEVPSVATSVVDRVGAGDAFMSVGALMAAREVPSEIVGLVGNAASAQAVATLGHQRSVSRELLVRDLHRLLQ